MQTAMKFDRGAGFGRKEASRDLLKRWEAAGCPENFCLKYIKGEGISREFDLAARREQFHDLKDPATAEARSLRARREKMKQRD